MIHTKNKDVIGRTEALLRAFGFQGGTVHQVAELTGCTPEDIIYAEATPYSNDHASGWFAYNTNTQQFNTEKITPKYKGNLQFWLGVSSGVQTCIKMRQETPKKF